MTEAQAITTLDHAKNYLNNRNPLDWPGPGRWNAIYQLDELMRDLKFGPKCAICFRRENCRYCVQCERQHNLRRLQRAS